MGTHCPFVFIILLPYSVKSPRAGQIWGQAGFDRNFHSVSEQKGCESIGSGKTCDETSSLWPNSRPFMIKAKLNLIVRCVIFDWWEGNPNYVHTEITKRSVLPEEGEKTVLTFFGKQRLAKIHGSRRRKRLRSSSLLLQSFLEVVAAKVMHLLTHTWTSSFQTPAKHGRHA